MLNRDPMALTRNVTSEQYRLILELMMMGFEVDFDDLPDGTEVRASSRLDGGVVFTAVTTELTEGLRALRNRCKAERAVRRRDAIAAPVAHERMN